MTVSLYWMAAVETFGPYEILYGLGEGGMGAIYLAREQVEGGPPRLVAIKRLLRKHASDPKYRRQFADEARILQHIDHECICRAHEAGEVDGQPYIAMEWIHGVSLRHLIERVQMEGLPVLVTLRILVQLARALEYSHQLADAAGRSLEVIHRDITPPNIMVGFDGRVKLLDFGIAKARTQEEVTASGMVKGKCRYLAPEQLEEERTVDWRVDVFALSVCGFESLTGRHLFDDDSPLDAIKSIQSYEAPPSIREIRSKVPAALEAILHRGLARNPARRFQTVAAMRESLEQMQEMLDPSFGAETMGRYVTRLCPDEAARYELKASSPLPPPALGEKSPVRPGSPDDSDEG